MKKVSNAVLATILMVSSMAVAAQAQSAGNVKLTVNIPFEFTTASGALPAGAYEVIRINPSSDHVIVQLRSRDGKANALLQMNPLVSATQSGSQLIFNRLGDHYFLSQVWIAGGGTGWQALKSGAEKEEMKSRQSPEKVAVTLSRN